MRKLLIILLLILFIPVYLVTFAVVHELGHTILARLLGDPNAVFYLAKIEEHSTCLGCSIYDHTRLSWGGNLVVSTGGLLATQLLALIALLLLRSTRITGTWQRVSSSVAIGFAFLDVPVQGVQGLLYNLGQQVWPTNVDLVDFMLLVQSRTGASQVFMKIILLITATAYLFWIVWSYKRVKIASKG